MAGIVLPKGLPPLGGPPGVAAEASAVSIAPAGKIGRAERYKESLDRMIKDLQEAVRVAPPYLTFESWGGQFLSDKPHTGKLGLPTSWLPGPVGLRPGLAGPAQRATEQAPTGAHGRGRPPLPLGLPLGPPHALERRR